VLPGVAIPHVGSHTRRDHGPRSDLDLVAIVSTSDRPFIERAGEWDLRGLQVPGDLLAYTVEVTPASVRRRPLRADARGGDDEDDRIARMLMP